MKNIAILGGTFNPIHLAHLTMAQCVYATGNYDEILFIPTGAPPHKESDFYIVDKAHRWNMCMLAIEKYDDFTISDIEMKRKGSSYTVDTLKALIKEHPDNNYFLIIGADSLMNLTSWHNTKHLFKIAKFLVLNRPGFEHEIHDRIAYLKKNYQATILTVDMPKMDISSSEIRTLISKNISISNMVPVSVEQYIIDHELYKASIYVNMYLDEVKKKLKKNLSEKKYLHSIAVEAVAVKLAKQYGVDAEKASIAALLHDCAKGMNKKRQNELTKMHSICITQAEKDSPDLLHAKLGPIIAKEVYGVIDEEILSAIECHTTGKPNMTNLDKIIYIADYIEPNRTAFPRIEFIRQLATVSLDDTLLEILKDTLEFLERKKSAIDSRTLETFLFYNNSND